ncbi:MAG: SagB/ThcOx family dehydrogenase [Micromonosporaceae bacterium]
MLGVQLPIPATDQEGSLEAVIARRRTVRDFDGRPISLPAASRLLWAAQGVTGERSGSQLRAAPSAGGLHPLLVTLIAGDVEELEPGGYLYHAAAHSLSDVARGDLRPVLEEVAIGEQPWLRRAAMVILVTGDRTAAANAYPDQPPDGSGSPRGVRYLHNEVGCVAQNVHLMATAMGLGAVFVGGFHDDALVTRLPTLLPTDHTPLALIPVGWPAG